MATPTAARQAHGLTEIRTIIIGSSVGAVIEYYDFFLYGSLANLVARQFFSGLDPTSAFIFALLAFAAGFIVRPLGAVLFGRLGDIYAGLTYPIAGAIMTFIIGALFLKDTQASRAAA